MNTAIKGLDKLSAYAGISLCGLAALLRIMGHRYGPFFGCETLTYFIVGTGLLVFSCYLKLERQD